MKSIHIGIIPDGSRRWAIKNQIKNYDGRQSGDNIDKVLKHLYGKYPQISDVSVWAMSTENLKRSKIDRSLVYNVLEKKMKDLINDPFVYDKNIKVNVVGSRLGSMPHKIRVLSQQLISNTKTHDKGNLNLCLGYGGKEEILDAVMSSSRWLRKNPTIAKLHESVFEKNLLIPKPLDIVIRTGGEKRLSGFMLYQIEYAELFFTDTLWPDFSTKEIDKIMKEFSERNRRFGR